MNDTIYVMLTCVEIVHVQRTWHNVSAAGYGGDGRWVYISVADDGPGGTAEARIDYMAVDNQPGPWGKCNAPVPSETNTAAGFTTVP